MEGLGGLLAKSAPRSALVFLHGELGAGKTTLVRGFLRALGVRGAVKSPTYTLVEPYEVGRHLIYHLDLYRLGDPEELELMGIRDYLGSGLVLMEWPSKAAQALPAPDLVIDIETVIDGRMVTLRGTTPAGEAMLATLVENPH